MSEARTLRANVAILFSERSRREYAARAQREGQTYRFTDARGHEREWLKGEYAYLAPNALSSILHRYALKHDVVDEDELGEHLGHYRALFVPNGGNLAEEEIARIADWSAQAPNVLVVSGKTNLPPALLGLARREEHRPEGYTGWRWAQDSPFGDRGDWEECYVSGYRGYTCAVAEAAAGAAALADLYEFDGDLSSVETATTRRIGHAIVATERTLYIANQVFEYLGGIMQAHINVEDVRLWSNPTHWGDTLAYFIRELLRGTEARQLWEVTLRPFGAYDGVLQLRHDADHEADESIDLSMLEYEAQNVVPATHYIMDPAYCKTRCTPMGGRIWVEETARYNFIEAAQHNDSVEGDPPRWITGTGLAEHLRESDLNLGLRSRTAGRHMGFLVYPETIDAMDYLYEQDPDLLGLCTFSLYDMLAYGERNPDVIVQGKHLTYATYDHARPEIPAAIPGYWFPYHVVVSTVDRQRSLRGWDVTHDTDCDYGRIEALFAGRTSKNPGLPSRLENGVYTIQYEVQLARDPYQNEGRGHLPWLRYAVAHAERCNYWLATKHALYERMNDYQDVAFRPGDDGALRVHNPTDRPIAGLMVHTHGPVNSVSDGEWRHIHIVGGRTFTLPVLPPGATAMLRAGTESDPPPVIAQPNSNLLEIRQARYHQGDETIEVEARAIRKSFLVLGRLPAERTYIATVIDNRGAVRQRMTSRSDGTLAIQLLGQQDNVIPIAVALRPQ